MNCKFLDNLKYWQIKNVSLADILNQPTSFPTACSNKKIQKPIKAQNPIKCKKPSGLGFF